MIDDETEEGIREDLEVMRRRYAHQTAELRLLKSTAYATHHPCGAILETSANQINNILEIICPVCDKQVLDEEVVDEEHGFYLVRKP